MDISLICAAKSSPILFAVSSKEIFSSCSPSSAFVDGVNIGSGNFCDYCKPAGSFIPHTV